MSVNVKLSKFYIGLGANLTPDEFDNPRAGCLAAVESLAHAGITITAVSRWYESAPVPASDQPWYLNAVAAGETVKSAAETLATLHEIEARFGRVRGVRNAARVLDLDLLDFDGAVSEVESLMLPHPRLHERAFVLLPLQELAPNWRHPVSGVDIHRLAAAVSSTQEIRLAPPL